MHNMHAPIVDCFLQHFVIFIRPGYEARIYACIHKIITKEREREKGPGTSKGENISVN